MCQDLGIIERSIVDMYNYTREVGYYILQTNENNGIDGSSILVEIAESKSRKK